MARHLQSRGERTSIRNYRGRRRRRRRLRTKSGGGRRRNRTSARRQRHGRSAGARSRRRQFRARVLPVSVVRTVRPSGTSSLSPSVAGRFTPSLSHRVVRSPLPSPPLPVSPETRSRRDRRRAVAYCLSHCVRACCSWRWRLSRIEPSVDPDDGHAPLRPPREHEEEEERHRPLIEGRQVSLPVPERLSARLGVVHVFF